MIDLNKLFELRVAVEVLEKDLGIGNLPSIEKALYAFIAAHTFNS